MSLWPPISKLSIHIASSSFTMMNSMLPPPISMISEVPSRLSMAFFTPLKMYVASSVPEMIFTSISVVSLIICTKSKPLAALRIALVAVAKIFVTPCFSATDLKFVNVFKARF